MKTKSLLIVFVVFLFWGMIFCLNDILLPYLKQSFTLSYVQASMIQFTFFGAYLVVSIPAGKVVARTGYKNGMVIGLVIAACGCAGFYPAAEYGLYGIFLIALFILSSGIALLQAAANPFVAALGPESSASARLNLAQAINKLGYALAPFVGTYFLFGTAGDTGHSDVSLVRMPYLILAVIFAVLGVLVYFSSFPAIPIMNAPFLESLKWLTKNRRLMLGTGAIFTYVGAEITTNAFFISFLSDPTVSHSSLTSSAQYLSNYWTFATVTGFAGFIVLKYIRSGTLLTICGITAMCLLVVAMTGSGKMVIISMIALGGFISIMFPTIFGLAIEGLGTLASQGSALLLTAVVGGALVPPLQGWMADHYSIRISFAVPCVCYLYVSAYGFWVMRQKCLEKNA